MSAISLTRVFLSGIAAFVYAIDGCKKQEYPIRARSRGRFLLHEAQPSVRDRGFCRHIDGRD